MLGYLTTVFVLVQALDLRALPAVNPSQTNFVRKSWRIFKEMPKCFPLGKIVILGLTLASSAQPAIIYQVTVTTAAPLNGAAGVVEMQFNPGGGSQLATANVSSFTGATVGSLESALPGNGVVTGDLSTAVSFTNTATLNDIAQNVGFGPLFQFILQLDGPALTVPGGGLSGTRFSLILWAPGFANTLVTADGVILTIDINPDGTITTNGFPAGNSIVSLADVSDVPEPNTWSLCLGAFGSLLAFGRLGRRN